MQKLNVLDTAITSGVFQTFTHMLEGSELEKKLRGRESYTLFAPVDVSFAYLPQTTLKHLLRAENLGVLSEVLGYHVIARKILSSELSKLSRERTMCGAELLISNETELKVNGARILHLDIVAHNGVIHGIDRMLLPAVRALSATARNF